MSEVRQSEPADGNVSTRPEGMGVTILGKPPGEGPQVDVPADPSAYLQKTIAAAGPARTSSFELLQGQLQTPLQYVADILFIAALGLLVGVLASWRDQHEFWISTYFWRALSVGLLFLLIEKARASGYSTAITTRSSRFKDVVAVWALSFAALIFVFFVVGAHHQPSRFYLVTYFLSGLVALGFWRSLVPPTINKINRRFGVAHHNWVVVGDRKGIDSFDVADELTTGGNVTPTVLLLNANCDESQWGREQQRVLAGACKALRTARNGTVYLCAAGLSPQRFQNLCNSFSILPVPTYVIPSSTVPGWVGFRPRVVGNHVAVELKRAPLNMWQRLAKRALDIVGATTGLLVLSPFFVVVALLIRLDSKGPVLFRQSRTGLGGKEFRIFKFRTMHVMEDGAKVQQACRDDPRVTRVGRFLRRTSIDELPQLLNVLKGEMSLVGPRPHAVAHDQHYAQMVPNYELRQHVKPGITGWAQVNGLRGETADVDAMRKRIEHDIWYVLNGSVTLDIEIIARTVVEIARDRNAY